MNGLVEIGSVLIIGYGNELRGDDGIGPYVVAELADLNLPGVRTRVVHQLVPELAEEVADVEQVIFVDAGVGRDDDEVHVVPIGPADSGDVFGHFADPMGLLALTDRVYGRVPVAWMVTVPCREFQLSEGFSEAAKTQSKIAIEMIEQWLCDNCSL